MIKIAGLFMLVLCGVAAGESAAKMYKERYAALCRVCDMLAQMLIMLEYEAPTVGQMINGVKNVGQNPPEFVMNLSDEPSVSEIEKALNENRDGFEERDLNKLKQLFSRIGSADKSGEQQRLAAAVQYFSQRVQTAESETAKRVKLAQSLGILAGAFAAVILA